MISHLAVLEPLMNENGEWNRGYGYGLRTNVELVMVVTLLIRFDR